jgi:transcriptional regulator with XRE-family HTH domain
MAATITSPAVTDEEGQTMTRSSPTLRRRRLSAEIFTLREHAGLTSAEATTRLGWGSGKLTRMERGEWVRPNPRDIADLCDLYGVNDDRRRDYLVTLAREGREHGWWHPYRTMLSEAYSTFIGLEAAASSSYTFDQVILPGLLQTEDYARAVILGGPTELGPEEIEQRVKIRMERQHLLTRDDPIRIWCIFDEAALRRLVGGSDVMRHQLQHLLELGRQGAGVNLQVVPFAAGAHAGASGAFSILEFPEPEDPDAVYIDTPAGELFVEEREEVNRFQIAFEHLRATALSTTDTLTMIADVASAL